MRLCRYGEVRYRSRGVQFQVSSGETGGSICEAGGLALEGERFPGWGRGCGKDEERGRVKGAAGVMRLGAAGRRGHGGVCVGGGRRDFWGGSGAGDLRR